MNEEISYQNQDLSNINPLTPRQTHSENISDISKKFEKIKDPKIRLLIILSAIVIVLLLLSVVVNMFREIKKTPLKVTPIVTQAPKPTEIPDNNSFPIELKTKFNEVDKNTQTKINFDPPQIDNTIGL